MDPQLHKIIAVIAADIARDRKSKAHRGGAETRRTARIGYKQECLCYRSFQRSRGHLYPRKPKSCLQWGSGCGPRVQEENVTGKSACATKNQVDYR